MGGYFRVIAPSSISGWRCGIFCRVEAEINVGKEKHIRRGFKVTKGMFAENIKNNTELWSSAERWIV